nr:hypothetical protein [Tanacetum cinerariifolium]
QSVRVTLWGGLGEMLIGTPGGGSGTLAEGTCGTQGWRSGGKPPTLG